MTEKQERKIRNKIAKIRKALAADRKRWGGQHHDGQGLRYLPPEQFIKLRDYKGGLRYLRWFDRTFEDDIGHPFFLFEWTLILFKTGKEKEAEKKAMKTFEENPFLFDTFLEKELLPLDVEPDSNWDTAEMAGYLQYSKSEPEFADFAEWLEQFMASEKFIQFANELLRIKKILETEPRGKKRTELVERLFNLTDEQ
jgi:hypothetical protein